MLSDDGVSLGTGCGACVKYTKNRAVEGVAKATRRHSMHYAEPSSGKQRYGVVSGRGALVLRE